MNWVYRRNSTYPYQTWKPFPAEAIVQVSNAYGDKRIAKSGDLWWGYEEENGRAAEGVISKARRLDKTKA